jgi:multiple sugar transport system substrate-binding protein
MMVLKKTKALSLVLILILVFSIVATACTDSSKKTNESANPTSTDQAKGNESGSLKGKKIDMSILGIGGWVPSKLSVDMAPEFAKYAKDKYGYDVKFSFSEAPFSSLFQKAAASMATKSQEFNIIISDSQWLGAFAKPGWISSVNDIISKDEAFKNIEWFNPVVKKGYMTFPDGSDQLWGLPQEGDVMVLYVRKDMLTDPNEKANFKNKYNFDLPQTFEDFEKLTYDKYVNMAEFFNRPDKGVYGTATQYSKEYDYFTGALYPFIWSTGGEIWDQKTGDVYGVLNTEKNANALKSMVDLMKYMPPGVKNYGNGQITEAFSQGKLFSAYQWAAVGSAMITPELKDKVMIVPIPGYEVDGKLKRVSSLGGQPWVINKFNDAEHMQVAVDFLKWWYLPETQLEFAKRGGNPTTKAALEAPGFEDIQPWFRAYKYSLTEENSRDFWHDAKYSELLSLQQTAFTAYSAGSVKDPAKVLEYVACEQQKILFEEGTSKTAPPAACSNAKLE